MSVTDLVLYALGALGVWVGLTWIVMALDIADLKRRGLW